MTDVGGQATRFEVPMANGEYAGEEYTVEDTIRVKRFVLDDALEDGPVVLLFFPGVFSPVCREEMVEFRDVLGDFEERDVQVYGVSVDPPFSQNAFINECDLNFPLLSDHEHELIEEFDVVCDDLSDLEPFGYEFGGPCRTAQRSIFAIDQDGEVVYRWTSDSPLGLPDVDEVKRATETLAQ